MRSVINPPSPPLRQVDEVDELLAHSPSLIPLTAASTNPYQRARMNTKNNLNRVERGLQHLSIPQWKMDQQRWWENAGWLDPYQHRRRIRGRQIYGTGRKQSQTTPLSHDNHLVGCCFSTNVKEASFYMVSWRFRFGLLEAQKVV